MTLSHAQVEAAEARAQTAGLVPVVLDVKEPLMAGIGRLEALSWALKTLRVPHEMTNARLWTTPEAAELMPALVHAHTVWPLQAPAEIAKMIGIEGLHVYHAAWALDAPDTDMGELLNTLANEHKRTRRRR